MHFEPTLPDNYLTVKACSAPKFLNCSKYYLIIARSIFIWIPYQQLESYQNMVDHRLVLRPSKAPKKIT